MVSYSTQAYRSVTDSPAMQVLDDLNQLLAILPERVRYPLETHPQRSNLVEVVLDIGRCPEARFANAVEYLDEAPVTRAELHYCTGRVGKFTGDNSLLIRPMKSLGTGIFLILLLVGHDGCR